MIGIMVDIEAQKDEYDRLSTSLLQWIEQMVIKLSDRNFPNSLGGMQTLMAEFKNFRTVQKPTKYVRIATIMASNTGTVSLQYVQRTMYIKLVNFLFLCVYIYMLKLEKL